jgi:RNA polymerase sigma-70 factor (sigma-E family)
MNGSDGLVLGAPAEPEPLGELIGTVIGLAGQAAALVTADEVDARLLRIAARAARPAGEAIPVGQAAAADAVAPARPATGAGVPRVAAARSGRLPELAAAGGGGVATLAAAQLTAVPGGTAGEWDVDRAVAALYGAHYRPLVRLAVLLVRDVATAEEVVQDSFVAMHGGWRRLRDTDKALSYLRQTVVNRSRGVLRHRAVADRHAPAPPPDLPSAEHDALALLDRSAIVAALRALPPRQREAVVLRYYGNLSEAEIAGAMGISKGAVKSHCARAMLALRAVLERDGG